MKLFDIPFYIKNTIKSDLFKLYCKKNVIKKRYSKKLHSFARSKFFTIFANRIQLLKTTKHK